MKIFKFKTNGSAKSTGDLMRQVVETYYRDMVPYTSLSLLEVFDRIKNLPYRPDPLTTETLMRPSHTMNMRGSGGDCLDGSTRLLTIDGYALISDIKAGDTIMGRDGWTRVTRKIVKGKLPSNHYTLTNGGFFTATPDHLCILSDTSEAKLSNIGKYDALLQPLHIPQTDNKIPLNDDDCRFIGYYLSDGWVDGKRVCISGKDGFPKEAQKSWVKNYAESQGWKTSWHPRYIRVYIPLNSFICKFIIKKTAIDKFIDIPSILTMSESQTKNLLEGLMADSHQPKAHRSGKCFGTISPSLKDAIVLLYRKLGIPCTVRLIINHGGIGKNPIYRIYPQIYRQKSVTIQRVESVGIKEVYDIETGDHGIYLPDADIIVHNCDDKAIALASYARLFNIPYRFIAIRRHGRKNLHHVAVELYTNNAWLFCDPTYSFNTIGRKRDEAERLILT